MIILSSDFLQNKQWKTHNVSGSFPLLKESESSQAGSRDQKEVNGDVALRYSQHIIGRRPVEAG